MRSFNVIALVLFLVLPLQSALGNVTPKISVSGGGGTGGTVDQGLSGDPLEEWYVQDAAARLTLSSILGKLDVNASTRASEATLSSFATQNHSDLLDVVAAVNSISGGSGDGAILDGVDPTKKATVTGANALKVDGSAVTQPVSGNVGRTWSLGSGTDFVSSVQSGAWSTGRTWTLGSGTDSVNVGNFPSSFAVSNFPSTQTVSGSVSVSNFPATQAVSGPLTDAQLRASPVDGSIKSQTRVFSTVNSTSSNLAGGAVFTGTSEDVSNYSVLDLSYYSAGGQVNADVQQSDDGTNWDITNSVIGFTSDYTNISVRLYKKYLRIKYTNVDVFATTEFRAKAALVPVGIPSKLTSDDFQSVTVVGGITVSSSALPTGAATSALQTTGNSSLSSIDTHATSIDTKLSSQATAANQTTGNSSLSSIDTKLSSQATAANQTTGNSSLSSIDTKLSSGGQKTQIVDASGNVVTTTLVGAARSMDANVTASALPTGAATSALQSTGNTSLSSINTKLVTTANGGIQVDNSNVVQPIVATSLPLPTGAATAANQTTGNTSLSNIDTKTPALVSGRTPVDGSGVTQPISAASLPLPSGAATSAKQPALGTAGTASADVITVQGVASMTPFKVDVNAGTNLMGKVGIDQTTNGTTNRVNIGSDGTVAATQSGAWTVQPGNTQNTTPWLTQDQANGTVAAGTAAAKSELVGSVYSSTFPSMTNGQQIAQQVDSAGNQRVTVQPSRNAVYMASTNAFTPAATPSDVFTIYGSGTKTIRVLTMRLSTTQTTAGSNLWIIVPRLAANTGGTSTNPSAVPLDQNFASATAAIAQYSANPTSLGTQIGLGLRQNVFAPAAATAADSQGWTWDFTQGGVMPGWVLRGTSQGLCLNFNGAVLPAGLKVSAEIWWSEE
jgi:hypothetical protein